MTQMSDDVCGREAIDTETLDLLSASLRELFEHSRGATAVSAALDQLGWDDVRQSDPQAAIRLLFTEQGRALAVSRGLDDVVLDELSDALPPPGKNIRAVLYPVAAQTDPRVSGIILSPLEGIDEVVVPSVTAQGATLRVLRAADIADFVTPVAGFDPYAGWSSVGEVSGGTEHTGAHDAWTRAEAAAHRAVATEIAAVCEVALAMAVGHAANRHQFGRSIATFQAVRHRLAEAHVEISAARTATEAAWVAASSATDGPWAARIAKLRAGRAQVTVFRHVLQVFGALGLTVDSSVHRYVVRAAALNALLGDQAVQAQTVGAALLSGAHPHPVVEI